MKVRLANMQIFNYQFKPSLMATIATVLLLVLFVNLAKWQSSKADLKQAKQDLYDQRMKYDPLRITAAEMDVDKFMFTPVIIKGTFEPGFQVLHDNQVYKGQAGYDVITPLHISGSNMRILVNRGWVPLGADRNILPQIDTPSGEIEIRGISSQPPKKYFELSKEELLENGKLKPVVQNLDLARYEKAVNFPIQHMIILMDASDKIGGFVRDWPKPDFKIDMNRGYAVQWYLLSVALLVIYFALNLKKTTLSENPDAK
jgi:surfeit locus 1 family protein